LTLLDLAFSDASTTYLDQTELHRTAHRLFKLLGNQRVIGGTGGKLMRELSSLVLHGNAKVSVLGEPVESVQGIRMPLMKIKKHKFNKGFIEWEVMQQMLQVQRKSEVKEAIEIRNMKPKVR
jgi:hypothetical protein